MQFKHARGLHRAGDGRAGVLGTLFLAKEANNPGFAGAREGRLCVVC
jgi:hypothetical protein